MAHFGSFLLSVTITATLIILTADFASSHHCCHCPTTPPDGGDEIKCNDGSPCDPHCASDPGDCNWFMCGCNKPCRGGPGKNDTIELRTDNYHLILEQLFHSDANHDGVLDLEEVKLMAQTGWPGNPTVGLPLEQVFKLLDKNADGKLTLEEIFGNPKS